MKRVLGFFLAFLLLTGGAAACSDDKDDTATDTTEASTGDGESTDGGDGGESGGLNADIVAYCESVDAFVEKAKEVMADPASADASTLSTESQELIDASTELQAQAAEFTEEDAKALADCTQEVTSALTGN